MNISNRTRWALVLLALVTAASSGCCCRTRKGIVLRGDWSLELNRVPHMRSNGPSYDADCCETVTCTAGGCADGGCTCGGGVCNGGCFGNGGGYGPAGGAGFGGAGGGYGDDAEGTQPPQPTPAAQSRFHPVPTRPVFEPQNVAYGPELHAPTIPNVSQTPAADATSRRRTPASRTTARRPDPSLGAAASRPTAALAGDSAGTAQVRFAAYEGETEPEAAQDAAFETAEHAGANSGPVPDKNSVAWHAPTRRR